jgi:rhamnulokinase
LPVPCFVAVDLGAGSGRVVAGSFADGISLDTVHRFPNEPITSAGRERWNTRALFEGIKQGLRQLGDRREIVRSIGVDTWGVDYGLYDAHGRLIEEPVCYRDKRTEGSIERVLARVPRAELFRLTGIQVQPFNTIYQLEAQRWQHEWPADAARMLMMPDIFHNMLCGSMSGEATMASTTQLVSADRREWVPSIFEALDLPLDVMPAIVQPGTILGELSASLRSELRLSDVRVVAPGTHDTASAVVGAPIGSGWAYLSSGTWSLLGLETERPIVSDLVQAQNLTNEAGVGGTNRLLKNIMGLWILDSCRRVWAALGIQADHAALMNDVESAEAFQAFIDPDHRRFFNPADMVQAVTTALHETGQRAPSAPASIARVILESLALRYAEAVKGLESATGTRIRGIRIIGGGSQNAFLNQATANAAGIEVSAGPVEATALGNLVVQAIADGTFASVAEARAAIAMYLPGETYEPTDQDHWAEARGRFAEISN